jgi:4-hydroxybenzoyl-CoA thioesterase
MGEYSGSVFVYRRRLQWGEGDAAQIGYTRSQLDILLEAVDDWWRHVVGLDWFELSNGRGLGHPCVHVELDFHGPVRPGQEVFVHVFLDKLGRSSMAYRLCAYDDNGTLGFSGKLVHVLIDGSTLSSTPIPDSLAALMRAYMDRTRDA